jgi:hypothetical protein
MLKISIKCTRFKTNYNSFTSKSSEDISKVEALKEKRKDRVRLSSPQKLSSPHP